jgi:hypothetical protein
LGDERLLLLRLLLRAQLGLHFAPLLLDITLHALELGLLLLQLRGLARELSSSCAGAGAHSGRICGGLSFCTHTQLLLRLHGGRLAVRRLRP